MERIVQIPVSSASRLRLRPVNYFLLFRKLTSSDPPSPMACAYITAYAQALRRQYFRFKQMQYSLRHVDTGTRIRSRPPNEIVYF